jgi:hypothetical protein
LENLLSRFIGETIADRLPVSWHDTASASENLDIIHSDGSQVAGTIEAGVNRPARATSKLLSMIAWLVFLHV